jgi:hypothetical protein
MTTGPHHWCADASKLLWQSRRSNVEKMKDFPAGGLSVYAVRYSLAITAVEGEIASGADADWDNYSSTADALSRSYVWK